MSLKDQSLIDILTNSKIVYTQGGIGAAIGTLTGSDLLIIMSLLLVTMNLVILTVKQVAVPAIKKFIMMYKKMVE